MRSGCRNRLPKRPPKRLQERAAGAHGHGWSIGSCSALASTLYVQPPVASLRLPCSTASCRWGLKCSCVTGRRQYKAQACSRAAGTPRAPPPLPGPGPAAAPPLLPHGGCGAPPARCGAAAPPDASAGQPHRACDSTAGQVRQAGGLGGRHAAVQCGGAAAEGASAARPSMVAHRVPTCAGLM